MACADIDPAHPPHRLGASRTTEGADAPRWEYATYTPSGQACPACTKPIGKFELCRRGELDERPGSPVVYRHVECPN